MPDLIFMSLIQDSLEDGMNLHRDWLTNSQPGSESLSSECSNTVSRRSAPSAECSISNVFIIGMLRPAKIA